MRVRYKNLNLQQLKTFREVCLIGSYAEVARQCNLSTSAVWEQMRGLERYFEATLLENENGKVQPTVDGRRILELTGPHLSGLETAKDALHQLRGEPPESITLLSGMRMLTEEISPAAARFRKRYPQVRLRLLYAQDRRIPSLIERGEADIGLMIERYDTRLPSVDVTREFGYELDFLLITPPRHPLLTKRRLRLDDLLSYPLILGAEGTATRSLIDSVLHQHGLKDRVNIAVESNSSAITFACVRAGCGIGITAAPLNGMATKSLGVRTLRPWFGTARFQFVFGQGTKQLPVCQELIEMIRQSATGKS